LTLSGALTGNGAQPPSCVADPLNPGDSKCAFTCGSGGTNCEDRDGLWETGCEVATNVDFDRYGLFVNQGHAMDCSVMQREAIKNPDMFRHHLHIDLTASILTTVVSGTSALYLPAGSIICNEGIISPSLYDVNADAQGHCFFMCIQGFINENGYSDDGCESVDTYQYPYYYGGYWMGDPTVEEYFSFLCNTTYHDVQTNPNPNVPPVFTGHITVASNVCNWNTRLSSPFPFNGGNGWVYPDGTAGTTVLIDTPFQGIPIWY